MSEPMSEARLAEIEARLDTFSWRHVPGDKNRGLAVNCCTRGDVLDLLVEVRRLRKLMPLLEAEHVAALAIVVSILASENLERDRQDAWRRAVVAAEMAKREASV